MKILARQYAQSLSELVKGKTEVEVKEILHKFVLLLGAKRDLNLAPTILEAFTEIWNKENGQVSAELSSARELSFEARNIVTDYLIKKSGAKTVVLEEKIDKKILGGFILKYNNKIIDGSLRNSLNELKEEMKS